MVHQRNDLSCPSVRQLVVKLEESEGAVAALAAQLAALAASDTLERARQQHDAAVGSLQRRHDAETLALKEALDSAAQRAHDRVGGTQGPGARPVEGRFRRGSVCDRVRRCVTSRPR